MTQKRDRAHSLKGSEPNLARAELVEAEIVLNHLALTLDLGGESVELPSIELSDDGGSESFTLERQELILRAIHQGLPLEQAAGLAGIHRTTVGRWRDKGEQAPDGPYGQFALPWRKWRGPSWLG